MQRIGIETARKTLGQLADAAKYTGTVTILTRHNRPIAAIVPMEHIVTHTAAITTASDCLSGFFCDVAVAEDDIINDGERVMSDRIVMDPIELTVHVDDEDKLTKAIDEAKTVLAANGWDITGDYTIADNAIYVPVKQA